MNNVEWFAQILEDNYMGLGSIRSLLQQTSEEIRATTFAVINAGETPSSSPYRVMISSP
jgi:hypothetical protein